MRHTAAERGWRGMACAVALSFLVPGPAAGQTEERPAVPQLKNENVEAWPRLPRPYASFDWRQRFLDFDRYVFDWNKKSRFPTIRLDTTHYNMDSDTVYIPAYFGDGRIRHDGMQDSLTFIAAVVGATLCGRDKSRVKAGDSSYDYVNMLRTFKHRSGKRKIVYPFADPGHDRNHTDWWYDAAPTLLYYMAGDLYPDQPGMADRLRDAAEGFYEMVVNLGGERVDFWHQAYDHDTGKPVDGVTWNGKSAAWKCPEAGVVVALVEYWAFKKFGDRKYLQAAGWCLDYFEKLEENPFYEMGLSLGPYVAAMINAEQGTAYDPARYIDWMIKGSSVRTGYGVAEANWNGYDVYGLVGSRDDGGGEGYVFGLETFANAFLAPAVKYDPRLARIAGRWLLHAGNAARFFYADQLPADLQFYGGKFRAAPEKVIPYEGLRRSEAGQSPRATGDAVAYNKIWADYGPAFDVGPECTNLAIYGGAWAGFFGAVLNPTNVPGIWQIDLNKLDFYSPKPSWPAYLYYNPHPTGRSVEIRLSGESDLFDILSGRFLARGVSGRPAFNIGPDQSISLLVLPPKSRLSYADGRIWVNGAPASYIPR